MSNKQTQTNQAKKKRWKDENEDDAWINVGIYIKINGKKIVIEQYDGDNSKQLASLFGSSI